MNIKLQKLITLFNERKNFFNNHPDTYRFMRGTLGQRLPEGTEIQVIVKTPDGKEEFTNIVLEATDKKFFDSVSDILAD